MGIGPHTNGSVALVPVGKLRALRSAIAAAEGF